MRRVALAQGLFNVAGGLWPLVSPRTFEAVYGRKTDRWLQSTVGGLLTTVGVAQLLSRDDSRLPVARALGVGTALTLLAVDVVEVPRRRISRAYLQDAVCQGAFLVMWAVASRPGRTDHTIPPRSAHASVDVPAAPDAPDGDAVPRASADPADAPSPEGPLNPA